MTRVIVSCLSPHCGFILTEVDVADVGIRNVFMNLSHTLEGQVNNMLIFTSGVEAGGGGGGTKTERLFMAMAINTK